MNILHSPSLKRQILLSTICLCSGLMGMMQVAGAENTAIKSTNAIKNTDAIRNTQAINPKTPAILNDSKLEFYDVGMCAEYLSLLPNSRYRYQASDDVAPADLNASNILGKTTSLKLQTQPAQQSKTTKITAANTATSGTTTETITTKSANTASLAAGQIIDVSLDHRTGLLRINGQIVDSFEKRMIQEDCRHALRK